MVALRQPARMTVAEFRDWQPLGGHRHSERSEAI
jgi:hypothetical protein